MLVSLPHLASAIHSPGLIPERHIHFLHFLSLQPRSTHFIIITMARTLSQSFPCTSYDKIHSDNEPTHSRRPRQRSRRHTQGHNWRFGRRHKGRWERGQGHYRRRRRYRALYHWGEAGCSESVGAERVNRLSRVFRPTRESRRSKQ